MDDLEKKLESLEIAVSADQDGKFTVFTTSEPLFCFTRDTEQELIQLVQQTLQSYVSAFYHKDTIVV